MDQVIIVDKNDNFIRNENKLKTHLGKGILHRAFASFIFNNKDELLITRRSKEKMLWPLYWDNTCCSHPRPGETIKEATKRRLREELGFTTEVRNPFYFVYQARFKDVGSEREVCHVPIGRYIGKVNPNPKEIAEWIWIDLKELKQRIKEVPNKYTPWFKIALKKLIIDYKEELV